MTEIEATETLRGLAGPYECTGDDECLSCRDNLDRIVHSCLENGGLPRLQQIREATKVVYGDNWSDDEEEIFADLERYFRRRTEVNHAGF